MLGLIAGGLQAGLGIAQTISGLTMEKPEIPDYDIPEEVYKNLSDAEYWKFQGLPEAQKQQFIEQSQRAGATALSRSSSRKGGLGLVSSIAQQEQDSATQLLSMDAQQRMSNLQNLFRSREVMAGAKDKKFGYEMEKVMYERQRRDSMIGAGMQNIAGVASTLAGQSNQEAIDAAEKSKTTVNGSMVGTANYGSFSGMNYNPPTTMNVNKGFGGMGNVKGFGGF